MNPFCAEATHAAIKTDRARWEAETVPTTRNALTNERYEKRVVSDGLEYGACAHCGTTLSWLLDEAAYDRAVFGDELTPLKSEVRP